MLENLTGSGHRAAMRYARPVAQKWLHHVMSSFSSWASQSSASSDSSMMLMGAMQISHWVCRGAEGGRPSATRAALAASLKPLHLLLLLDLFRSHALLRHRLAQLLEARSLGLAGRDCIVGRSVDIIFLASSRRPVATTPSTAPSPAMWSARRRARRRGGRRRER